MSATSRNEQRLATELLVSKAMFAARDSRSIEEMGNALRMARVALKTALDVAYGPECGQCSGTGYTAYYTGSGEDATESPCETCNGATSGCGDCMPNDDPWVIR